MSPAGGAVQADGPARRAVEEVVLLLVIVGRGRGGARNREMPRGHWVGVGVEGQMLLLLLLGVLLLMLLMQSRRGQLLLMLLLLVVMLLLPRHVLRVEEHGCGRGGVVLRLRGRVPRGSGSRRRRLRDGLVGVAAGVGRAGRRRGQDVGGGRRGRAVGALALRREGPGGSGGSSGCGGGGVSQI